MARFTFRLQTVLEHRKRLEELAQLEHAKAKAAQLREEQTYASLREAEDGAFAELERQRMTGRLDIEALQFGMGYLDLLKVQLQRQEQVVTRVRRTTAQRRDQLVGALQDRKALERLREQRLDEFKLAENRREANDIDEMAVMRNRRVQQEQDRWRMGAESGV